MIDWINSKIFSKIGISSYKKLFFRDSLCHDIYVPNVKRFWKEPLRSIQIKRSNVRNAKQFSVRNRCQKKAHPRIKRTLLPQRRFLKRLILLNLLQVNRVAPSKNHTMTMKRIAVGIWSPLRVTLPHIRLTLETSAINTLKVSADPQWPKQFELLTF